MRDLSVLAMGGNSLIDSDRPPSVENQIEITQRAIIPVAELISLGHQFVITFGNGPQVGFLAMRSQLAKEELHEVPLDALVADTQGSIGYMIQRALREELRRRGHQQPVVTLVTEIEVDPNDDAFEEPTKPIGLFYGAAEAQALIRDRGWSMIEDAGRGWRWVVPSPAPVRIVQLEAIQLLIDAGCVVICCGGGGIPVTRQDDDILVGVEGVIDKDRASALLGVRLGAKRLFITTGVEYVYRDFASDHPTPLYDTTVPELNQLAAEGQFPPGSMGPKIKAASRFLKHGGKRVTICDPAQLVSAFTGQAGTRIHNEKDPT